MLINQKKTALAVLKQKFEKRLKLRERTVSKQKKNIQINVQIILDEVVEDIKVTMPETRTGLFKYGG